MGLRKIEGAATHSEVFKDFIGVFQKHRDNLTPEEMLAIACNIVGKLICLQDQRKYSKDQIMHMVMLNIEQGNLEAFEMLAETKGNA